MDQRVYISFHRCFPKISLFVEGDIYRVGGKNTETDSDRGCAIKYGSQFSHCTEHSKENPNPTRIIQKGTKNG